EDLRPVRPLRRYRARLDRGRARTGHAPGGPGPGRRTTPPCGRVAQSRPAGAAPVDPDRVKRRRPLRPVRCRHRPRRAVPRATTTSGTTGTVTASEPTARWRAATPPRPTRRPAVPRPGAPRPAARRAPPRPAVSRPEPPWTALVSGWRCRRRWRPADASGRPTLPAGRRPLRTAGDPADGRSTLPAGDRARWGTRAG